MKDEAKEKAKEIVDKAFNWIDDHKWFILAGVTIATAVINKQSKKIERFDKLNTIYDASAGHYWELRKPLKNKQFLEIESRKAEGEKLGEILEDMGVLKK